MVVLACLLLVSQDLEMMLIHKSWFLQEEHGWMEQEVVTLQQVDEVRHKLESTRCES